MDADAIILDLEARLPEMAKQVISRGQISHGKERFLDNPDSVEEHEPRFHEYGIITHSRKFREAYENQVAGYLEDWGLGESVDTYLSESVDGVTKRDLLRIAMPLHDIGKFAKRITKDGRNYFREHAELGGEIVAKDLRMDLIEKYGLTDNQVDYVARCVRDHFALGKLRNLAKEQGRGFNLAYVNNGQFIKDVQKMRSQCEGFEVEAGLLFLADVLSKVGMDIDAETEEEIESQMPSVLEYIKGTSLDPISIAQNPVNKRAARRFLEIALH